MPKICTTDLKTCQNGMLRLAKRLIIHSQTVDKGRYMRGSDGKLYFNKRESD